MVSRHKFCKQIIKVNFLEICFLISRQFTPMHEARVSFYRTARLFVVEKKIFPDKNAHEKTSPEARWSGTSAEVHCYCY